MKPWQKKIEKSSTLKVGNETLTLVFTHRSIAVAEEKTGMKLLMAFDSNEITADKLAGMLLSAALKHHPDLTLDDCWDILDTVGTYPVFFAVLEAWTLASPNAEAGKDTQNPTPQPPNESSLMTNSGMKPGASEDTVSV